jgi:hypothetical protein
VRVAALLAHGIGGRTDLPLPAWLFRYGAAAAVLASFAALALFWPTARLEGGGGGRVLAGPGGRLRLGLAVAARALGLAAFVVVLVAAAAGDTAASRNLAPVAVYVTFWVGLAFISGIIGDLWRVLSPFDTLAAIGQRLRGGRGAAHEAAEADADRDVEAEADVEGQATEPSCWPAAAALLVFVWVELVYPDRAEPRKLFVLMAAYSVVMLAAAARWGREWLRRGEAFSVLFGVLAHMAPLHRDDEGRLRLRPPFVGLATLVPRPGLEALVMIALGSTTFDGVTRTQLWGDITTDLTGASRTMADTGGLLWCIGMVAIAYIGAMRVGAGLVGYERSPDELRADFVHSLVPIALAYAVAHYFSLLVLEGQAPLALISDPFGRGWDLFGTATWKVNFNLVSPRGIALVQAGAIVVGHIAGVVIAHDRALALFDRKTATRSQYPLLAVMVLFTVGGLFLLLGG